MAHEDVAEDRGVGGEEGAFAGGAGGKEGEDVHRPRC